MSLPGAGTRLPLCAIALLLALALPAPAAPPSARYQVAVSADLRTLTVRACFDGAPPRSLRAGDEAARRYLDNLHWLTQTDAPRPRMRRGRIALGEAPPNVCVGYDADVGRAADSKALRRSGWRGDDLLISPELWLWAPSGAFEIAFQLPDGINVSAPWPALDDSGLRYRAGETPIAWAAQVAFGRLQIEPIRVGGGTVHLALVNPGALAQPDAVVGWVEETAAAVASIYGRFPRRATQVLVVPGDHGGRVVPWGQVLRGGAPAVHFFVDNNATTTALRNDWTAFHELSHLLLPFVRRADAFVSEGFASYFQNVSRGRSKNVSSKQAWTNLYRGYQRGLADTDGGTLSEASRGMGRNGHYMRVYWSGAALALMADVALRTRGQADRGLDAVLADLAECCLDTREAWSARRLFERLDALSDSDVFTSLLDQHREAREFPDVFAVLHRLGVYEANGEVRIDDESPLAHVRKAIMRAAPEPR